MIKQKSDISIITLSAKETALICGGQQTQSSEDSIDSNGDSTFANMVSWGVGLFLLVYRNLDRPVLEGVARLQDQHYPVPVWP
jgi:hypothetical protein